MLDVGLDELAGDILRDLKRLGDGAALGEEAGEFVTGREEAALWKGFDVDREEGFGHARPRFADGT